TPSLISLPEEVLRMILRLATCSNSRGVKPHTRIFLDADGRNSWSAKAAAAPLNKTTKLALSLASRRLREVSAELRYESLILTVPQVRKVRELIRTGCVAGGFVKHLKIVYKGWQSAEFPDDADSLSDADTFSNPDAVWDTGELPDNASSIRDLLGECVCLESLDLTSLGFGWMPEEVKGSSAHLYELWRDIPAGVRTIAVRSHFHIPFAAWNDAPGLQAFLDAHKKLTRWEIELLIVREDVGPDAFFFSKFETLAVGSVATDGSMRFALPLASKIEIACATPHASAAMRFGALKHVHITSVFPFDDLTNFLCDSPSLESLVCNVCPPDDGHNTLWDTGTRVSSLEELTVGILANCDGGAWKSRVDEVLEEY
ncbi:hypothetical protein SCHPADRAFT_897572, partial [Schizopora paradoxa]